MDDDCVWISGGGHSQRMEDTKKMLIRLKTRKKLGWRPRTGRVISPIEREGRRFFPAHPEERWGEGRNEEGHLHGGRLSRSRGDPGLRIKEGDA